MEADEPLTVDDLARQVKLPVRTIREYHTMRLLPPPERRGRVGLYGSRHVQRLQLIARLQRRGYSLAGIRDLLGAWESGTDLVTLLGVDQGQPTLDEAPLRLTRAELLERLPALDPAALDPAALDPATLDPATLDPATLDPATLDRATRIGLAYPDGTAHFVVRSPALLGLVADWSRAGVPLGQALDVIEALTGDLDALAGTLVGLIVDRVWAPIAATERAADLPNLLRRGRPLLLQGVATMLAERLGAALAERADATGDDRLRAALDDVRVGAVTDSAGTIHRRGIQRGGRR
jgi:DNA-binding transcriptional MerR regulator